LKVTSKKASSMEGPYWTRNC